MARMFYTYLWLRENGTPYYVGKGSGTRAFTNVGHTIYRPKDRARILLQYWASEAEAFRMEIWYIHLFGRQDIHTGILRNLSDGGSGPAGAVFSQEHKDKISAAHKGMKKPWVITPHGGKRYPYNLGNKSRLGRTNSEEMNAKIRSGLKSALAAKNAARTHCGQGHELSEENRRIYRGHHLCRVCQREWKRTSYLRRLGQLRLL